MHCLGTTHWHVQSICLLLSHDINACPPTCAGLDILAGGSSPRVERGGQDSLADILDNPSAKDAEKLMETVVKASSTRYTMSVVSTLSKPLPNMRAMGLTFAASHLPATNPSAEQAWT